MKIFEVIRIMLTYRGSLKSEDKWEQLSGIYWNNFFIYAIVILCIFVIAYLVKHNII